MIELGREVQDKVTGFRGIATAKCEYLNGCVQFCVTPKMIDGKFPDGQYIDIQQLEVVGEGIDISQKPTGGSMQNTPSATYIG